ncbi:M24 family metallopeptidase [Salinigranum salinum]|uniref:M24 family metallopeptidase n=1 Tax=Salinigranum salinum TaxID=1364937 RepID=UPI0012613346|nr:M24 family metallopeptidase [Salinigranum salinum]
MTDAPAASDLDVKTRRLDDYLHERDLDAVWFARPNSFAWLTGGASNVVDRDSPAGVAAAGYDGDEVRVVTNDIEAERLAEEELPDAFAVESSEWHAGSLADALADRSPTPAAADIAVDVEGWESVDASTLRQPLTDADVDRYRDLGHEVATAVERICRALEPEDTEREVAAALRVALSARGIESPVALVGGADRAGKYRHYTPTEARLGDYALVSVTAQRGGLYASLTRTVAFDPPGWLPERHTAAARIETSALAATQVAATRAGRAGNVFADVQEAYASVGWDGEWRNHHQGGAAGYAGREWIATPDSGPRVHEPMAYAWNPTVQGAKSEDTSLVTADGFETLTTTGEWPTVEVEDVWGTVSQERHDVLRR